MATYENPYYDDSETDWVVIAKGEMLSALLLNDDIQFFSGAQLYNQLSPGVQENLPISTLEQIAASIGVVKVSD